MQITKLYINLSALLTMHPNDNMNDAVIGDGPPKSMSFKKKKELFMNEPINVLYKEVHAGVAHHF